MRVLAIDSSGMTATVAVVEDTQTIASLNKDTSSFFSHYDPATVEMICGLKR